MKHTTIIVVSALSALVTAAGIATAVVLHKRKAIPRK